MFLQQHVNFYLTFWCLTLQALTLWLFKEKKQVSKQQTLNQAKSLLKVLAAFFSCNTKHSLVSPVGKVGLCPVNAKMSPIGTY